VILGLGSGGFAATLAIRRVDPKANITIIEKRGYDMFSPCGMPFALQGIVGLEELKFTLPSHKNITKLLKHEAKEIKPNKKEVIARNLETNEVVHIPYDSLIIALGAQPFIPPIEGAEENMGKGVFVLESLESAKQIIEYANKSRKAVIIGAGPIGLEVAIALSEKLEVTVVEMLSHAFPKALDKDMAKLVEDYLKTKGIELLMNKTVKSISTPVESVYVGDERIETDMVVLASGVKSNIEIAKKAGIEIGKWGIKTNARMETNIKGIYAVGDCTETVSLINHRATVMQLSTAAFRQGMVAGTNAAGGYDIYEGALSTFVSLVGDLEVASTGFNSLYAQSAGFEVIAGKAKGKTKPEYYPGAKDITLKVIADARSGKLLGAQAVGEGAGWRINVISLAIKCGISVYDLREAEMAYCPMLAENYDVINKAADFAVRKLEKRRSNL